MKSLFVFLCGAIFLALATTNPAQARQQPKIVDRLDNPVVAKRVIEALLNNDSLRKQLGKELAAFRQAHPKAFSALQNIILRNVAGPEILVKFKAGTSEEQILSMSFANELYFVKAIPQLRIRVFRIPVQKKLDEVIAACKKLNFVEYAEPNRKVGVHR